MSGMSWQEATEMAEATFLDQEARRSALAEREAALYADDPFAPTPPSAVEEARVRSDDALLTAAADRLEQLLAAGSPLPWCPEPISVNGGERVYVTPATLPRFRVYTEANSTLIVALVNAGPALVAWLRSAARDAREIGPDRFAVALARQIMGEEW